jgi:hypothetical protein
MPEKGFQLFHLEGRSNAIHSLCAVEAAIRDDDVAVGIEAEGISEGLRGNFLRTFMHNHSSNPTTRF